jgi:hypothetical protein
LLGQIKVSANGESTFINELEKDTKRAGLSSWHSQTKLFKARKEINYPCTIQKLEFNQAEWGSKFQYLTSTPFTELRGH